jgi:hypothetical protein
MTIHTETTLDVEVRTSQQQRRVPRQPVGWSGKCVFSDDPAFDWAVCQVLDISILGAGIEIFGPIVDDVIGREITVQVLTSNGSVSIRLVGIVRGVGPGPQGGIRAGIEFPGLSDSERTILDALERMKVVW